MKNEEIYKNDQLALNFDLNKTFETLYDLVVLVDNQHRIIQANPAFAAKLGFLPDGLAGALCFEIVCNPQNNTLYGLQAKTLLCRLEIDGKLTETSADGCYDIRASDLYDHTGKVCGKVFCARDITLRKKSEQVMEANLALGEYALNHSLKEVLRMTIDKAEALTGSTIGFFHFLDSAGDNVILQAWSTRTVNMFCSTEAGAVHYPIEEAGAWVDCYHEKCPVIHNDFASLPHRKGIPAGHAVLIRELTVPVIRNNKVVAILGVGNKPTDYDQDDVELVSQLTNLAFEFAEGKRFEEALHKSEQYARALLDAIPDMIFRLSRDGVYLDFKGPIEELYYQSGPIIGKSNREMAPAEFAGLIEEKIKLTLDTNSMVIFEYQLPIQGKGLRDFEARMAPSGKDEVTAIARDITERKATEKALKKKIAELEGFNRLMVDREVKMVELKREINQLAGRLGEDERYIIHQI